VWFAIVLLLLLLPAPLRTIGQILPPSGFPFDALGLCPSLCVNFGCLCSDWTGFFQMGQTLPEAVVDFERSCRNQWGQRIHSLGRKTAWLTLRICRPKGECCHFHLAPALLEGPNGPPWHLPGAIKTFKGNQKDLGYEMASESVVLCRDFWSVSSTQQRPLNGYPVDASE
jgi:hypothetical protein